MFREESKNFFLYNKVVFLKVLRFAFLQKFCNKFFF
jgi:hypothetical protein